MSEPNSMAPLSTGRWPKVAVSTAGLLVSALGLLVIVGWYAHWARWLQVFPDAAPMQFNTALCFILCGASVSLLNTRLAGATLWCAGAVVLLTSLTLLEYSTGRDFGIDLLLFKPYFQIATAFPGRMAPLTAMCFILFGVTFGLAGIGERRPKRMAAAGLLATIIAMVGFIAVCGYLTGIKLAYGWGAYTLMAFPTAVAFAILGAGMLLWCWQTAKRHDHSFVQWVPIAASATLIVMVGVISAATVTSLRRSLDWRRHTYEVLLVAQSLVVSVTDIQAGMQGYALTGQPVARAPYDLGAHTAPRQLAQLVQLTHDNPAQQRRLEELTADLTNLLSYAGAAISVSAQDAPARAAKVRPDDEGERILGQANALMYTFVEEEQRLLVQRTAAADADFRGTVRLLAFGSVLATLFLVGGSWLVRRELTRRHRVELELRDANEKVNTLSGLLPMCAHCISIRDDKGYWNQIESYIQERSEATFSHGLCENCVRELYPSIADRVLSKMREGESKAT
ncbi:MAG: CHASE3 domain-containing protein [Chthoniobacter sp.]|uniref:CHASE3 domain-containing protein n=1 Tax=Chthoniobacter sp. TaxID=2510640 RepID=UPI0032ADFC46